MGKYRIKTGSIRNSAVAMGADAQASIEAGSDSLPLQSALTELDRLVVLLKTYQASISEGDQALDSARQVRTELTKREPDFRRIHQGLVGLAWIVREVDVLTDTVIKIQDLLGHVHP